MGELRDKLRVEVAHARDEREDRGHELHEAQRGDHLAEPRADLSRSGAKAEVTLSREAIVAVQRRREREIPVTRRFSTRAGQADLDEPEAHPQVGGPPGDEPNPLGHDDMQLKSGAGRCHRLVEFEDAVVGGEVEPGGGRRSGARVGSAGGTAKAMRRRARSSGASWMQLPRTSAP